MLSIGVEGLRPTPNPKDLNGDDAAGAVAVPDSELAGDLSRVLHVKHDEDGSEVDLQHAPDVAAVAADLLLRPLLDRVAMQGDVGEALRRGEGDVGRLPLAHQLHRHAAGHLERLPAHGRLPVLRRAEAHHHVAKVAGRLELENPDTGLGQGCGRRRGGRPSGLRGPAPCPG